MVSHRMILTPNATGEQVLQFLAAADVNEPFSEQPKLVRIGSVVALGPFIIFLAYVPTALAVALLSGIGTASASREGLTGALAFVSVMAAVGAWTNGRFLRWLRDGRLSAVGWCSFNAACLLCSVATARVAVDLQRWSFVFAVALVAVVAGLLLSWILVMVGNRLGRLR